MARDSRPVYLTDGPDGQAPAVQLTGSKVGLATDPMPAGNEGDTYMQYDEATGETKVFKYIGGAWREL